MFTNTVVLAKHWSLIVNNQVIKVNMISTQGISIRSRRITTNWWTLGCTNLSNMIPLLNNKASRLNLRIMLIIQAIIALTLLMNSNSTLTSLHHTKITYLPQDILFRLKCNLRALHSTLKWIWHLNSFVHHCRKISQYITITSNFHLQLLNLRQISIKIRDLLKLHLIRQSKIQSSQLVEHITNTKSTKLRTKVLHLLLSILSTWMGLNPLLNKSPKR